MLVREYTDADFSQIKALHEKSKLDYVLPSIDTFFSKHVASDGDDVGAAILLRKTCEVYLICNPTWRTPAWRDQAIRQLHIAGQVAASQENIQEAMCWVPPEVNKSFGRRLKKMGWFTCRPEWECFWRQVNA